jgi:hypothetical protein
MRKYLIALAALTLLTAPVLRAETGSGAAASMPAAVKPLGVDQLMKEPEKHSGALVVEGVVKTASKTDQSLALIDVEEYRKCRMVTCSLLALPVRWAGEMPAVLDVVRVEGEVTTVNGKMLFAARKLEKVPEQKQQ